MLECRDEMLFAFILAGRGIESVETCCSRHLTLSTKAYKHSINRKGLAKNTSVQVQRLHSQHYLLNFYQLQ